MSIDVASLVFEIDSTQAVTARERLESLEKVGARVDAVARKVRTATDRMNEGRVGATGATQRATAGAMALAQAQGAVERATQTSLTRQGVSWREFVSQRMGDYMRLEGGHSAAMKRIGAEWQAYKATATDAAQGAATAMIASQGAVEKATRQAGQASADTRAQRALEAAAMRELVLATKAYERDQAAAAKAAAAAAREQAAAIASLEARIFALKSSIDPTFAAQSRLDAELQEAAALYKAGAISSSDYARAVSILDTRMDAAARGQATMNGLHVAGARGAKLQGYEMANLGSQFADIGVSLASGQALWLVAIQQGSQIGGVYGSAAARGVTLRNILGQLGGVAGSVANKFGPGIIATVALGGAFAIATQKINEGNKDIAKGLGLTSEQLERVKNDSVTMADTAMAVFEVAGRSIYAAFAPQIDSTRSAFKSWYDELIDNTVKEAEAIVGVFGAAFGAIKATWGMLPFAISDVIVSTANLVIGAVEKMVNVVLDQLRRVTSLANQGAAAMGWGKLIEIPDGVFKAERLDNRAEGVGRAMMEGLVTGANKGRASAISGLRKGMAAVVDESLSNAAERIRKEAGKAPKAAKGASENFQQATDALNANAKAALEVARAYGVSDEAVMRAEAHRKALTEATRKGLGVEAMVAREQAHLAVAIAEVVLASSKSVSTMNARTAAQKAANDAVTAGTMTIAEANQAMQMELELRPLATAATLAQEIATKAGVNATKQEVDAAKQATAALDARKAAIGASNAVEHEKLMIQDRARQADELEMLEAELRLIGATNAERAVELAILKAKQDLARDNRLGDPGADSIIEGAAKLARRDVENRSALDAYNDSLSYQLELLRQIDDQARSSAQGMSEAFGQVGAALGDVLTVMTGYAAKQQAIADERAAYIRRGGKDERELALFQGRAASAQVQHYGDVASAAKGFFKEGSAGYRALEAAERTYRLFEFAMSVRSLFLKAAETSATVAGAGVEVAAVGAAEAAKTALTATGTAVRTPLKVAEGAASMFAALGPFGFVAVAGMMAIMAGLGFMGGRGGGAAPGATDMEDRQKAQGAGSVLGDATAKSESIARALEIVASNTNKDLEFSNAMLKSLRSIDSGIGAVAAALARTLGAGGSLSTDKLAIGTTGRPATLGNLGFGATTTRSLQDQGVEFGSKSLSDILASGIEGNTFQQVLSNTVKKAFGITYSNKSSVETTTGALDADFSRQVTQLIGSLKTGVLEAADILGVQGAAAILDSFQVNLGKLSFKDMSGSEIQEALNGIFGKLGDDLAATAIPELLNLQKVGEGAFETLTRVARQYQVVDVSLASIGMTFGAVGVASLAARERLVDLAGGIDALAEQTNYFAENFLTDLERMAPIQQAVATEMARLGLAGVTTKDQFKSVVLGLDLTTAAGAATYAALMSVAPAFAKVVDFAAEGSSAVKDARDVLTAAYERESGALQQTIDKFKSFSESLARFRDQLYIGPQAMLSPEEQYRATKAAFDQTSARALGGDEKAIGDLQAVSQAYLDASKDYYASSKAYFDDLDAVRAAVTATQGYAASQVSAAEQELAVMRMQYEATLGVKDAIVDFASALLAYQAAQETSKTASRKFDGSDYLAANDDLLAAFQRYQAGDLSYASAGYAPGMDADQFGQKHWDNGGKDENRRTFVMAPGPVAAKPADNAAVVAELKALNAKQDKTIAELQADKVQRAAMELEQKKRADALEAEIARLSRMVRDAA